MFRVTVEDVWYIEWRMFRVRAENVWCIEWRMFCVDYKGCSVVSVEDVFFYEVEDVWRTECTYRMFRVEGGGRRML